MQAARGLVTLSGRKSLQTAVRLAALTAAVFAAACLLLPPSLLAQTATPEQIPVLEGQIKLGVSGISQYGNVSSTIEAYNLSKGLTLSSAFLRALIGENKTVTVDLHDVTQHQANASVELSEAGLFSLKFDYARLRYLESASSSSESIRDAAGLSGNLTPTKWLKLYGGLGEQKRRGNRVAYLTDDLDFPGSVYDYSMRSRMLGAQLRARRKSLEVSHEWRWFTSEANAPLNRDGHRLRVTGMYGLTKAVTVSGSYVSDESELQHSEDAVLIRSYSGVLEVRPAAFVTVAGYANHQNTKNDITSEVVKTFSGGSKVDVSLRHAFFLEGGYEFTLRQDEPQGEDSDLTERQVSTDAFIAGLTARYSEKAKLTVRYRTRNTDRSLYPGLTGPFDTDYFLAKVEGYALPGLQYAVSFMDKERSNDEIVSSSWSRGPSAFANWTLALPGRTIGLRVNGSVFRNDYTDLHSSFETDNVLVTASVRLPLSAHLTAVTGITHIDVRGDLDIRKDLLNASLEYAIAQGYSVEARYDLLSYDDFVRYGDNYAANVFTVSLSRNFSALGRSE